MFGIDIRDEDPGFFLDSSGLVTLRPPVAAAVLLVSLQRISTTHAIAAPGRAIL